jgi:hypothetical protein
MLRAIIPLMLLLCSGVELRAQDVSQHARETVKVIRELRTIPLPNFEFRPSGPPARVPGLLRQLNQQLRDLIIAVFNDQHRDSLADADMVYNELKAAGWGDIYRSRWNAYGEISNIDFQWETDHDPPLLVVDTELWVPCGSDSYSTIYVFQKKGRSWELVLATDADYLAEGEHPDGGMQYVVSSQDQNGNWYLGVASVFPNCRNDTREVRFKVLRPGPSPEDPVVLVDRSEPVNDKFDAPFDIAGKKDNFSIMLGKERRLDGELGISISSFDVRDDHASRVPPFALKPEDFLDEWVRADWVEVAPWTNKAKGADLEAWHARLKALAYDSTEMEFVQPCPAQRQDESTWLLGLWLDQKQNRNTPDERLYIGISKQMGAYFVDGIQKTRPAGCPGNTRPSMLPELKLPPW